MIVRFEIIADELGDVTVEIEDADFMRSLPKLLEGDPRDILDKLLVEALATVCRAYELEGRDLHPDATAAPEHGPRLHKITPPRRP
jgi:hypothetical protein